MNKRNTVLVTAGPVYGKIDSNKIVSNRSRGLWATKIVPRLKKAGYDVVMLVPVTLKKEVERRLLYSYTFGVTVQTHDSYEEYARLCYEYAETGALKGVIMAAAVLNYIPVETYDGKMPTDDEIISIDFKLAPKVINGMKERDPYMTLIGCKLLFDVPEEELVDAAYKVILNSKANAVVANEGGNLKRKLVVHQDRTTFAFDDDFKGLYDHLVGLMGDNYYSTSIVDSDEKTDIPQEALDRFDACADKFRDLFVQRHEGDDFYLGAVATRFSCAKSDHNDGDDDDDSSNNIKYLVSPREKGQQFDAEDAVVVHQIKDQTIHTEEGKASLNAPLLVRHLDKYPEAYTVLHFHEDREPTNWNEVLPNKDNASIGLTAFSYPFVDYAPPGSCRDNEREIPKPCYYIEGHGWILALDEEGHPLH